MINDSAILAASILIVDDLEANVRLLDRMLRGAGYTAITTTMDPRAVHDLHDKNAYDLILLDLEMPQMTGFEVMEDLKTVEHDGYLPVLVITAQPDHKVRALKAGAKDFVSKPIDLAELLTRVRNMLEVRLLHREAKRLYEQVLAEQAVSERLLRTMMPRSVAERQKADRSVSELLRLSEVGTAGADMDTTGLYRRSAKRTAEGRVALTIAAATAAGAGGWALRTLPPWPRVLAAIACALVVLALIYAWNCRFVAGEMQSEAKDRRARELKAARAPEPAA